MILFVYSERKLGFLVLSEAYPFPFLAPSFLLFPISTLDFLADCIGIDSGLVC